MAFKHLSFLEVVARHGVPFLYNSVLDPMITNYHAGQLMVIYHKPGDMDYPVSGAVSTQALTNVWGKFVFPENIGLPYGSYIRIPKLDRAIIRQLEYARIRELQKLGSVRKSISASGERIIDLGGLT